MVDFVEERDCKAFLTLIPPRAMPNPPKLTDAEINQYYQTPEPAPPANTYEVALVLGGTVSAGAYTAGVLDFLIQALDEWTKARDNPGAGVPSVPTHKVVLKVITGTSGGGINAMIAAKALGHSYPPMVNGQNLDGAVNPFYKIWVQTVTMLGLLDTSDLNGATVPSLLNDHPRDVVGETVVAYGGPANSRSYAGYPGAGVPLRIIQTLTNLAGIPYPTALPDGNEVFIDHADYIRYAVAFDNLVGNPKMRPDEYLLPVNFDPLVPPAGLNLAGVKMADWEDHAVPTSKGTSTFPPAFPPPYITRDALDYRWRATMAPPLAPGGPARFLPLVPDWNFLQRSQANFPDSVWPEAFKFQSLDGGMEDNEPIKLALDALLGFNIVDEKGANACRGMIIVDPLIQVTPDLAAPAAGLLDAATQTIFKGLLEQTRYDSSDILLAADPEVYSRFLVYPQTPAVGGQQAARGSGDSSLASAGFGAFIGFACEDYLDYDFMLGRANCQAFLQKEFVVNVNNPVVAGQWTAAQQAAFGAYVDANGNTMVPLIPLVGTAAAPQALSDWPVRKFDPNSLRGAIEARVEKAVALGVGGFGGWVAGEYLDGKIADYVIGLMQDAQRQWGL